MQKNNKATIVFLVALLLALSSAVFAQPGGGGPPGPGKPVPIGGVGWLLAVGGALGLRELMKRVRK